MKSLSSKIQERLKINKDYVSPMSGFETADELIMIRMYDWNMASINIHILNNINIEHTDANTYILTADESNITELRRPYMKLKFNKEKFISTGHILYKIAECGSSDSKGKILYALILPEYIKDIDKAFSGFHYMKYVKLDDVVKRFNFELDKYPDDFISDIRTYEIHTNNKVLTQVKNYLYKKNSITERLIINKNFKRKNNEKLDMFLEDIYKHRYETKYFATLPDVANVLVMLSAAISKYKFEYESDTQKNEVRDFVRKFNNVHKIYKTYTCIRTEDLINAIDDKRLELDMTIQNGGLRIDYSETDKFLLLIFGSYETDEWNIFIGRYLL